MKWKGGEIANVDSHIRFWDKSDPYLKFLRVRKDDTFIEVGRTEVIMDNPEPDWKPVTLPAEKLIDMNIQKKLFKV